MSFLFSSFFCGRSIGCLMMSSAIVASAQYIDVKGVLRDPNQLGVEAAEVVLDGAHVHQIIATEATGRYQLSASAPGSYTLTARKPGLASVSRSSVLTGQSGLTFGLSFVSASASADVTVRSSAPGTSEAGYYVGQTQAGRLGSTPICAGLSVLSLLSGP